ncbi:hypothetical protein ABFP37_22390, partial [Burkholderia sp. RS01]|uniref:hypothetical protein n=1 Tax=unclassified Burkholderia TaxID=2613784 RepID=UPI003218886B
INKLGTLLSSQTTDTPGTTTTKQPWIAPEQLFKLTRSGEPLQISVSAIFGSTGRSPPVVGALVSTPFSGCFIGGGRYFSASAAATRITLHTRNHPRKSAGRTP